VIEDLNITIFDGVDKLPPACIDLMKVAGEACFFQSPGWFKTLEANGLTPSQRPRYYVVSAKDGAPLGILPMMSDSATPFLKPRVLKSLSSFYTMDFAPILSPAHNAETLEFLARTLSAEKPAFDIIDIHMLTRGTPLCAGLEAAFAKTGRQTDNYFEFDNWVHEMGGQSAADYYEARPSRLKNTIRRKRKKFEEAHKLSFLLVNGPENLEKAIADYQLIYDKSWKEGESFQGFIPALMRLCASLRILRLGVIYADDKPVAAQFWMIYGKTAMIYKLAYDEDYANLSAGSILSKYMMDQAIDADRVQMLDYGLGNDGYKRDWMTIRRQKIGILLFNRTISGLAAAAHHFIGKKIRQIMKPASPAPVDTEAESASE
jgi:CelD/BcsL family acetyltransferase involved in cellulose biosynthesis